jgi:hypothetical protein
MHREDAETGWFKKNVTTLAVARATRGQAKITEGTESRFWFCYNIEDTIFECCLLCGSQENPPIPLPSSAFSLCRLLSFARNLQDHLHQPRIGSDLK